MYLMFLEKENRMDTAKIFFIGDGCLMEYSISDELEAEMRKVLVGMNYHV